MVTQYIVNIIQEENGVPLVFMAICKYLKESLVEDCFRIPCNVPCNVRELKDVGNDLNFLNEFKNRQDSGALNWTTLYHFIEDSGETKNFYKFIEDSEYKEVFV